MCVRLVFRMSNIMLIFLLISLFICKLLQTLQLPAAVYASLSTFCLKIYRTPTFDIRPVNVTNLITDNVDSEFKSFLNETLVSLILQPPSFHPVLIANLCFG